MANNWVFSLPNAVAFCVVMALWFVCMGIFIFKKKGPQTEVKESRRERASVAGIVLQSIAFASVWALQRRPKGPIVQMPDWAQWIVAVMQILLAIFAVWISATAIRTLGKQWTYVARTIEGHELITAGPYRLVRNPIYLGMFSMLVASAVSVTRWQVLLPAIAVFLIGAAIRIRSEEKVLRATFGKQFEDYSRRVPAFFPGIW